MVMVMVRVMVMVMVMIMVRVWPCVSTKSKLPSILFPEISLNLPYKEIINI